MQLDTSPPRIRRLRSHNGSMWGGKEDRGKIVKGVSKVTWLEDPTPPPAHVISEHLQPKLRESLPASSPSRSPPLPPRPPNYNRGKVVTEVTNGTRI